MDFKVEVSKILSEKISGSHCHASGSGQNPQIDSGPACQRLPDGIPLLLRPEKI